MSKDRPQPKRGRDGKVRYAVFGLGWIAQSAMLPGFANVRRNSTLAALVSDDPEKSVPLSQRYGVPKVYTYEQYDECLQSGEVDAVYVAIPNELHRSYAERAARAGVHVLVEKPLAVSEAEGRAVSFRLWATDAHQKNCYVAWSGQHAARAGFDRPEAAAWPLALDPGQGRPASPSWGRSTPRGFGRPARWPAGTVSGRGPRGV